MTEIQNTKQYDLEDRTFRFAQRVRLLVKLLPKTLGNSRDSGQLIDSSGSVGANYIEANEAISKKDFIVRVKICRKEAKESAYWLRLLDIDTAAIDTERKALTQEAKELTSIFGAILKKTQLTNA
jgi:four helix bundle protein